VWSGKEPVAHVLRLIEHLAIMPRSRIAALEQGDLEWMGWDGSQSIAASTHNWIVRLICGLSKVDPDPHLIRTPGAEEEQPTELTFSSLADLISALDSNGSAAQFLKG
jgi:hypothetical protein